MSYYQEFNPKRDLFDVSFHDDRVVFAANQGALETAYYVIEINGEGEIYWSACRVDLKSHYIQGSAEPFVTVNSSRGDNLGANPSLLEVSKSIADSSSFTLEIEGGKFYQGHTWEGKFVAGRTWAGYPKSTRIRDIIRTERNIVNSISEAPLGAQADNQPLVISPLVSTAGPEDEGLLKLTSDDTREIQRRLTLLGFDTKGADGAFGPNTRSAITLWQQQRSFPASGFLNEAQKTLLFADSQDLYDKWRAEEAKKPKKRRVKVCQRGALGLLVNCRMEWR